MTTVKWYHKLICRVFGHIPTGPQGNYEYKITLDPKVNLEPFVYLCSRCIRTIRFNKEYPNGWVITSEIK